MAEKHVNIICTYCNKEKMIRLADYNRGRGKFCSRECSSKFKIKPLPKCLNCDNDVNELRFKFCSLRCSIDYKVEDVSERFWDKVNKTDNCWEWNAGLFESGYGAFNFNGNAVTAHRLSYELIFGKITNELHVLHKCDNRKCVNPEHLYLGTQLDNARDMMDRGRHGTKDKGWPSKRKAC